jgi:nicotinic acid phosphoribosyltransferase
MYRDALQMSGYASCRSGFKGENTNKMVFFGTHFMRRFIEHQWTIQEIEDLENSTSTFGIGGSSHPFPSELFRKFVTENNGYFPVKLDILPEGSVVYAGTPVYQITGQGEYSRLTTYLETILSHLWYSILIATLSRLVKEDVEGAYDRSVDDVHRFTLNSRLHDFGMRGTTCFEQSIIGGVSHLLSFCGSDTFSAVAYVQNILNDGEPYACSIPASEHSVMTSWADSDEKSGEEAAVERIVSIHKSTVFATVADSYCYEKFFENIFSKYIGQVEEAGGCWVVRPDSGDPCEAVLFGLSELKKYAKFIVNSKGFIKFLNCAIVQGDGLDRRQIQRILKAVMDAGFSVENVCFGMGGGLLQKNLHRGTMDFSTKLSHIIYADGTEKDVMKAPTGDSVKISLPGRIDVCANEHGIPQTYPESVARELGLPSLYVTVWDCGPVGYETPKFTEIVQRVDENWRKLPEGGEGLHESMKLKQKQTLDQIRAGVR